MGMIRTIGLIALMATSGGVLADPSYHRVVGVAADDTLNIRSLPSADGEDIGDLAHDATAIEVIGYDETGDWARIALNERDGWIAAQFLEPDALATLGESGIPHGVVCGGTEPFWAMGIYSVDARYSHPEDGDFKMDISAIRVAEGRTSSPVLVSLTAPEGEADAVIEGAMCSDGMSDRSYGWMVRLKMETGGTDRFLVGCCHLPRE